MSEKKTHSSEAVRKKYDSQIAEVQAYNRETTRLRDEFEKSRREGLKALMDTKLATFTDLQESEAQADREARDAAAAGMTPAGTPRNPATPHQVDERTPAPEDADRTPVIREDNPSPAGGVAKAKGKGK